MKREEHKLSNSYKYSVNDAMKCDLPSYVSSEGFSDDKNLPSAMRRKENVEY